MKLPTRLYKMILIACSLVFISALRLTDATGCQVNAQGSQGFDIRITGETTSCPNAPTQPETTQTCRPGKAGPKGEPGVRGEKGDAAEVCECIANSMLLERIDQLESK